MKFRSAFLGTVLASLAFLAETRLRNQRRASHFQIEIPWSSSVEFSSFRLEAAPSASTNSYCHSKFSHKLFFCKSLINRQALDRSFQASESQDALLRLCRDVSSQLEFVNRGALSSLVPGTIQSAFFLNRTSIHLRFATLIDRVSKAW